MRTLILLTCVVTSLIASGCKNRWEMKWPGQKSSATTQPADGGAAKTSATRPVKTSAVTPQQEIDQLQRQVKTLRERLNFIEDENIKLRQSNKDVAELQIALKQQMFTAKMQADDLKVLKTAAIERDLYKTRSERLEREVKKLKITIAKLQGKPPPKDTDDIPEKAPAPKPAGL
jgi:hypothetical protein